MQLLAADARMDKFASVLDSARAVLAELVAPLDETEEILGKDGDLLEGLKNEINVSYEAANERIRGAFFTGLEGGFAAAVEAAQSELAAATGWGALPAQVMRGGSTLPAGLAGLGKRFRERLSEVTEARVISAMTEAESDAGGLWEKLSARVAEDFEHQLSAGDGTGKAVWSGRGEALLRRAEACVGKACNDYSIEDAVAGQRRQGTTALRFFAISALILALAAGVLSGTGVQPYHWLVAGLAVVALGFGAGQFIDGRRRLKRALAECAGAVRIQLRADLSRELTSHVHGYYTKLGSIFDPVQELCQRQVDEVSPQIAAVRQLGAEVGSLAGELERMRENAKEYLRKRDA